MNLDFSSMKETCLPNFKGGEKWVEAKIFEDSQNKIILFRLIPGASVGYHTHNGSNEIIYVLEGTGKVYYDGTEETISPGICHYCPEHHSHGIVNDSESILLFFAVVANV